MNSTTVTENPVKTEAGAAANGNGSMCSEMQPPPVTKQHEWLRQFVGEWDVEIEIPVPGQPPMKARGLEQARMLGNYFLVTTAKNNDFPYECQLTLGYDPENQRYVGTWADSMTSYLWHYRGQVDPTGKILTLETEGPFPGFDGMSKFRETTEFKTPDHRVFTAARLEENGSWKNHMQIEFRRRR